MRTQGREVKQLMFNGIYSSASAMDVAARQHEVISNNLAHLNVPGFRRTILAVQSRSDPAEIVSGDRASLAGSQPIRTFVDFTPGGLNSTSRPLDVALAGDGFFKIEGPDGQLLTRNGSFHLTGDGQLITADGLAVLGEGGPLQIPTDVSLDQIIINIDGRIVAADTEVGRLAITAVEDPNTLVQIGSTRFRAPVDAKFVDSTARVQQGVLESGNAVAVSEMIQMIVGMRHYEAAQQSLRTISEATRQFATMDA